MRSRGASDVAEHKALRACTMYGAWFSRAITKPWKTLYKQVQMPMMDDRLLTFATDNGKLQATESSEHFAPVLPLDIGPALPILKILKRAKPFAVFSNFIARDSRHPHHFHRLVSCSC
jgi:hypothetical protein